MKWIAIAALFVLAVPSANATTPPPGSVLTALADIGTVTWRADCPAHKPQRWALGVRMYDSATTKVTLRVGQRAVHKTMQPNQRLWFALSTVPQQHLAFSQLTRAGTLRGTVSVDFGGQRANHCQKYFPPRVSTELYPRR